MAQHIAPYVYIRYTIQWFSQVIKVIKIHKIEAFPTFVFRVKKGHTQEKLLIAP